MVILTAPQSIIHFLIYFLIYKGDFREQHGEKSN